VWAAAEKERKNKRKERAMQKDKLKTILVRPKTHQALLEEKRRQGGKTLHGGLADEVIRKGLERMEVNHG